MKRLIVAILALCLMSASATAQRSSSKSASKKQKPTASKKASTTKKSTSAKKPSKKSTRATSSKSSRSASKKSTKSSRSRSKKSTASSKKNELSAVELKIAASVKKLKTSQRTKLLRLLNEGEPTEIESIQGIGKTRAKEITKKRPFKKLEEVFAVNGIGVKTFDQVLAHASKM